MGILNRKKKPSQEYIDASVEAILGVHEIHANTWGIDDPESELQLDLDEGKVTFIFPDKKVTADIQVIGTLHDGTFLWGWDHPSVPMPLREAAVATKEWGTQNSVRRFTQRKVNADVVAAWEFTAVAARLFNASGAHSANNGTSQLFFTFGPISITKN